MDGGCPACPVPILGSPTMFNLSAVRARDAYGGMETAYSETGRREISPVGHSRDEAGREGGESVEGRVKG